jgi:hypothetical protein
MKQFTYLIILLISTVFILGCEDVVEIELDEFAPELVVDAWVNDLPELQVITLSETANYFDPNETPRVNEATVVIVRDDNQEFNFQFTENGRYVYDASEFGVLGDVGNSFELQIQFSGQEFCAQTELNRVPEIESIELEFRDEIFFPEGIYAQFIARDFNGLGDAYWIKTFKNGVFRNNPRELNIAFDAAFDAGSGVDGLVFIPPIRDLVNPVDEDFTPIPWLPEETIKVEIHSISNDAFQFLEIARDQMQNGDNGIFALPLANTRSNISNCSSGELSIGFFNVASVSSASRVIE